MKQLQFAIIALGLVTLGSIIPPCAQATVSDAVLADNPVAFYQMNETTGTTAIDSIAAQNGTYSGGLTLGVAGPRPPAFIGFDSANNAVQFGGVNGKLDTGSAITSLPIDYSYEIWFNYTFNGNAQYIGGRFGASYPGDAIFAVGHSLSYFDGTTVTGAATFQDGWNYLVMTHQGSTVDVYLDGAFQFSATSTDQYGASNRIVAGTRGDGGLSFNGALDDLAVYNTVLTPTQIEDHYLAAFTVPEPSSLLLLGVGGWLVWRRARKME